MGVMVTPVKVPPTVYRGEQEIWLLLGMATQLARWNFGVYDCQKGKTSTAYSKLPRRGPGPAFAVRTFPA